MADTLRAAGRPIPGDVALVGFDNWAPMALGALPPLTSVDMCLEEVGRAAAERLLAAIAGEPRTARARFPRLVVHIVPVRLVVRQGQSRTAASRPQNHAQPRLGVDGYPPAS